MIGDHTLFMVISVKDKKFEIYIHHHQLIQRCQELADIIKKDHDGERMHFVCVLNGSFMFAGQVLQMINQTDCDVSFIKVSSYHGGLSSNNNVELKLPISGKIEGERVIILEDIVDSGRSMKFMTDYLSKMNPKTIKKCVLFHKKECDLHDTEIDYLGFEIPDKFIVGFGLDYAGCCRTLRDVYELIDH